MGFVSAIIAAGGAGSRMSLDIPKQFYRLDGKMLLEYAVKPFDDCALIDEIIIVAPSEYVELCLEKLKLTKPLKVAVGGETRQQSVRNGLIAADSRCSLAIVHDGARPFVTQGDIVSVIGAAKGCAAAVGTKVYETIKYVNTLQYVESTLEREKLWSMQTPQAIPYEIFIKALKKAEKEGVTATDDVSLAELIGCPVRIVEGSAENIKITSDKDLLLASLLLDARKTFSKRDF